MRSDLQVALPFACTVVAAVGCMSAAPGGGGGGVVFAADAGTDDGASVSDTSMSSDANSRKRGPDMRASAAPDAKPDATARTKPKPGQVDCTFPNDPSICGCGNACPWDDPGYGICKACGTKGSGCKVGDIWCCSDAHCPSGWHCDTLTTAKSAGSHLCAPNTDGKCNATANCLPGEKCIAGWCRDGW